MALGGICGSLLGGYALTNFSIDKIFLLFSILPTIQLLSCGMVEEKSVVDSTIFSELSNSKRSDMVNGNGNASDEEILNSVEKYKNSSLRRKKSQKNSQKRASVKSNFRSSLPLHWFRSLKEAMYSLCNAFKQPMIFR